VSLSNGYRVGIWVPIGCNWRGDCGIDSEHLAKCCARPGTALSKGFSSFNGDASLNKHTTGSYSQENWMDSTKGWSWVRRVQQNLEATTGWSASYQCGIVQETLFSLSRWTDSLHQSSNLSEIFNRWKDVGLLAFTWRTEIAPNYGCRAIAIYLPRFCKSLISNAIKYNLPDYGWIQIYALTTGSDCKWSQYWISPQNIRRAAKTEASFIASQLGHKVEGTGLGTKSVRKCPGWRWS